MSIRERECLHWLAEGDCDKHIGERLAISARTFDFMSISAEAVFLALSSHSRHCVGSARETARSGNGRRRDRDGLAFAHAAVKHQHQNNMTID